MTSILTDVSSAVIIDRDGDFVWWHSLNEDQAIIPRARLARDGQSVLYLHSGLPEEGGIPVSTLVEVGLDGSLLGELVVDHAHHDFVELPGGALAFIVSDSRLVPEGGLVKGDAIVEWNPGSGEFDKVWSTWDSLPVPAFAAEPGESLDWTHANALVYDAEEDTYSVSSLWLGTIITIGRSTGTMIRQVGGLGSDFELDDKDDSFFDQQHQFQFIDDHLLVFDNGLSEAMDSRVVEYELDADLGTASEVWSYAATPALYCPVHGDVNRLEDGSTLITWSTSGRLEAVSVEGETHWRLDLALGGGFGYTTHVDEIAGFGD